MRNLAAVLMLVLVALLTLAFSFPAQAQEPVKESYLSGQRFTVTAGLGQHYETPKLSDLSNASPVLFGWGTADYRITDSFLASVDARRNINGGGWGTDLKVGYKFGIGAGK